jgi:hypothetical protein
MSTAAAAIWAAGLTQACDAVGIKTDEDDFAMHGPVRQNDKVLTLPEAQAARDLLTPYHDGRPFMRRWAVGHVAEGKRGQITVLLVDLDSGGHAEFDLYARDRRLKPIAHTTYYDIILDNGEQGRSQTPMHLERLGARLAEIISTNEEYLPALRSLPRMLDVPVRPEAALETTQGV